MIGAILLAAVFSASWQPSEGATAYTLYVCDARPLSEIRLSDCATFDTDQTTLDVEWPETPAYVTVRAVNAAGYSGMSEVVWGVKKSHEAWTYHFGTDRQLIDRIGQFASNLRDNGNLTPGGWRAFLEQVHELERRLNDDPSIPSQP